MSLAQTIQYELSSVEQPSASSQSIEHGTDTVGRVDAATDGEEPTGQRRVFEAMPLTSLGRSHQVAIAVAIIASNLVQMISNVVGIAGGLKYGEILGEKGPGRASWVAASYPLTQGTFVLASGRLGAVYGHKYVLLAGGAWFVLWSLINGFCNDFITFNIARAFSGIGGALIMPNAVAIIGITLPPGRYRNLSLSFFAASAPMGGFLGSIITGIFTQYTPWKWNFFSLAILGAVAFGLLWFLLPPEVPVDRQGAIDYVGAALGTCGLILFNFVWNQAPMVGWSTPYEIILLIVSIVSVGIFCIWESKFAKTPIMPLDIWKAPSFLSLMVVSLLSFMSFGTMLWYMVAWQQEIRHWTVLQFAYGWAPFVIFGIIGAILAAWLIPRLAAQWILAIGALSVLISNILIATMPKQQSYWAQVFPATIVMAFCPDFVYTAAQIIASNSVRRSQQGIAASLIGTLNLYGTSLGIGFAGTVESEVNKRSSDQVKGYRAALYFGIALAVIALVLDVLFVRMARDEREGWASDEEGLEDHNGATGTVLATARSLE